VKHTDPACRIGLPLLTVANLMSATHKCFGQVGDDALGAAVELGRHALIQRCYLGDPEGSACRSRDRRRTV
jgi:hypothetical protein